MRSRSRPTLPSGADRPTVSSPIVPVRSKEQCDGLDPPDLPGLRRPVRAGPRPGPLRDEGHRTVHRDELYGLPAIGTDPRFGIGQRALLVPGEGGNVLWDCITYLDDATIDAVNALGGISAIAISHPHYYGTMVQWSEAFGGVPIHIHRRDEEWVQRRGEVRFWDGDSVEVLPGRTLYRAGIHFAGGTILHWPDGVDGRGAL